MEDNLGRLLEELDALNKEREKIIKDLREDLKDPEVKKCIDMINSNQELDSETMELAYDIKEAEMRTCSHIWIMPFYDKTLRYDDHTCIKCGLNTYACKKIRVLNVSFITRLDKIMDRIIQSYFGDVPGIRTEIKCDPELAKGIYKGIVSANPDITDEQAVKYLNAALHNIRTRKVTDHVKVKRIERLHLPQNFNAWNEDSIYYKV